MGDADQGNQQGGNQQGGNQQPDDDIRTMIRTMMGKITGIEQEMRQLKSEIEELRDGVRQAQDPLVAHHEPPQVEKEDINDPDKWPLDVMRDDVRRAHLLNLVVEDAETAMRTGSKCSHKIPGDKAALAQMKKTLNENIKYYAQCRVFDPNFMQKAPPIIMEDLANIQTIVLRHVHGEDVADHFKAQMRTSVANPKFQEALRSAIAFGRDKSLMARGTGNGGGRGQGQHGSKGGAGRGRGGKSSANNNAPAQE